MRGTVGVFRTVTAVVAGCLIVAACGTDPPSGPDRATAEPAIHAAVVRQLVEFNNTFGPDHRFTEVLVVDHVDAHAGDPTREGEPGASLTDGQRSAIRAAVEHLAPVRFITNRYDYIRREVLQPTIPEARSSPSRRSSSTATEQPSGRHCGVAASAVYGSPTASPKNPTAGP